MFSIIPHGDMLTVATLALIRSTAEVIKFKMALKGSASKDRVAIIKALRMPWLRRKDERDGS